MSPLVLLAAAFAVAAAGAAHGGAWPREPGAAFLSLRGDALIAGAGTPASGALYGEYGLTKRATLVGQFASEDRPGIASRAAAGINFALGPLDARHRLAIGFGVSAPPEVAGVMTGARIETALHWGTGFESRFGGGWATATARLLQPVAGDDPITDLHGLIGLRPREGWMTMLAVGRYADEEGVTLKLTPSLGYRIRENAWIVPSITRELTAGGATSAGVAIWLNF